jgi:hypothetical protein
VALGDRAVHGWNPDAYAALLGVRYDGPSKLAPAELADRLDVILTAAGRLVERLPEPVLAWTPPERRRTVRELAYHVFRLSLAFVDAMERGQLPETWFDELPPPEMADGAALARYGAGARERLARWFAAASPDVYARVVDVYYGPQGAHDLLERTVWHAAQHLRQLDLLAERHGVTPRDPLPVHAFAGLPLPESLW